MRFEALLGRTVRGFWAASYSFDLKLFDQYLLRRLAQSPLNAVVLADYDKVAAVWDQLDEGQQYLARQIGRRYLLRGIRPPGGGAFHPKTYLLTHTGGASLVVGSGNLTRSGIDHGREVFTTFSTESEADLPSLRAWALWTGELVASQDDPLLRESWGELRVSCPWMSGPTEGSRFLTNSERPLLDQLSDRLPQDVVHLHVTAPYYDRDALALGALVDRCNPSHLTLYVGAGVSVHGEALAKVLKRVAHPEVKRFLPHSFVHAKLIGAIGRDGSGVLLSGSPNLSRAALTLAYGGSDPGNCEVAVLGEGDDDQVRQVFETSGLELVDEPLDWLAQLQFHDDHPDTERRFALRSAEWQEDGRIRLRLDEPVPTGEVALAWVGSATAAALQADGTTLEPLNKCDPMPTLVFLTDAAGASLSNRVIVDDPAAIRETLTGAARKNTDRPRELDGLGMAPLVRLALWAHEKFIFDLDDTSAFRRARDAAGEATDAEDATDFWQRYAEEELQYDPRSHTYKPLTASATTGGPVDELLRELERLLHAAPDDPSAHVLRLLTPGAEGDKDPEDKRAGTPWTMEARQQVRAFNLLTRWTRALADPRHSLLARDAPVVNYQTLLAVLVLAWMHNALDAKRLRELLRVLMDSFVGPADGQGYLGRIDQSERAEVVGKIEPEFPELLAGLVYLALTEDHWQADIYDWQPSLQRALESGIVLPGPLSDVLVARVRGDTPAEHTIDDLLMHRIDWVDDKTWCKRLAAELALPSVALGRFNHPAVQTLATVEGPDDPATDARLLTVAHRILDFKKTAAVAVRAGEDTFVLEPGAPARARIRGAVHKTSGPIDTPQLREIEAQGGTWADLLGLTTSAAA